MGRRTPLKQGIGNNDRTWTWTTFQRNLDIHCLPCTREKWWITTRYRQLNAKTFKIRCICSIFWQVPGEHVHGYAYPLPHLDNLLGSMAGAPTLDAASGYWQIPLAQEAIELSGFVTKYGTYEFRVMPFGLTSAPSCFQRTMANILGPFIGKFVYVFVSDIIIFLSSRTCWTFASSATSLWSSAYLYGAFLLYTLLHTFSPFRIFLNNP